MKRMVWDDDEGRFIQEDDGIYVEIEYKNDAGEVIASAQTTGPSLQEAMIRLTETMSRLDPELRHHVLGQIHRLLKALVWKKLAESKWGPHGSGQGAFPRSDEWRKTYLKQLAQGSGVHRRDASGIR